jgi:exopolysaccharide biosynthesis predicted pyruvyltransferase EpsI
MDVSLNSLLSFEHFCVVISHASIVLTTRLHVGILAAMMEKPTIIVPGSVKYGKIQGIYDYSLHDYSNVQLVDNPFTDRESR